MTLSAVFLIVYIFFLPVFVFLLCLAAKKRYKNYLLFSFWISNIGEQSKKSYWLFSINLFVFGALEVCFSFLLLGLFPAILISEIAVLFFALIGFLIACLIFFPMDKKPRVHGQVSTALFAAVFLAFALALYLLVAVGAPKLLIFLNILVLIFSVLLGYSYFSLRVKYKSQELKNLAKIRKKETSFILDRVSWWEWLVFIFFTAWLFVAAVSLYVFHV